VTLIKPGRASVQVFSGRTAEPVWFLKLWLIGFIFCLPTPTPPLVHMLLLLPLLLHFSNGITDLVIFVALAYHL
jgi:hypothetical protein